MRPVVDGLKGEYSDSVRFEEINFYENRDLAAKYGVSGHPSLVFTKPDGSRFRVLAGVPTEETIEQALKDVQR